MWTMTAINLNGMTCLLYQSVMNQLRSCLVYLMKTEECGNLLTLSSMNSLNWSDFEVEKNEQLVKCDLGITPLSMNSISYSDFEHSANELNETTNQSSKLQLNSPSCPDIIHTPHSKDTEESSVYSYVLCQDAATSPWAGTQ